MKRMPPDENTENDEQHGVVSKGPCSMRLDILSQKMSLIVIYLRINCLKVRSSLGVLQVDRNGTHVEHAVFDASTPRPDERFI